MRPSFSRRAIRGIFYLGGVVATGAGLHTAAAGARSVPNQELANPSVESELRFYGAFYLAYGLAALQIAPQADTNANAVRAHMGVLFAAGLARAGGWLAVGRPHRFQLALLAVELALPPSVVAWQARIAR